MDNSIDVFTKLQTLGLIIVPLFAICLIGLLKDELGLNDTAKTLANLWKSFRKRLNSTKIATKVLKPDESELAKLLNDNGFSISYQANDICGGKCWNIWKPTFNEKPAFLYFP